VQRARTQPANRSPPLTRSITGRSSPRATSIPFYVCTNSLEQRLFVQAVNYPSVAQAGRRGLPCTYRKCSKFFDASASAKCSPMPYKPHVLYVTGEGNYPILVNSPLGACAL
jgi:hypothetical protein